MSKYLISWTEEDWYKVEVEAESQEDALDKWCAGNYDGAAVVITESGILQEGVDVMEVSNG